MAGNAVLQLPLTKKNDLRKVKEKNILTEFDI